MSEQQSRNDAADNERVGSYEGEKQVQDTSTNPLSDVRTSELLLATAGVAVGLYALRSIPAAVSLVRSRL